MSQDALVERTAVPIAEALSKLLGSNVEIVIHSLATETVAYICNPYSKRQIGDPSYLSELDFREDDDRDVIGPHERVNWDGRVVRTISAVLRDDDGKPFALTCFNYDLSDIMAAQNAITALIGAPVSTGEPDALFKNDWHEKMNRFIVDWCRDKNKNVDALAKEDRLELLGEIVRTDGLREKHAASYVARVLNVSRATIYNDIKVIR
ncbi:PAS domain-containing protein [Labrenzia sp. DG1229]|uniref:helix-turn-helix transcriptional regulator n=1 Tax=Labrenzia sp. DG1229 TaxID=681847 RepID=UPI00048D84FF|nr:PAS domain-containing protein [Labrenzia sp. DG1229]